MLCSPAQGRGLSTILAIQSARLNPREAALCSQSTRYSVTRSGTDLARGTNLARSNLTFCLFAARRKCVCACLAPERAGTDGYGRARSETRPIVDRLLGTWRPDALLHKTVHCRAIVSQDHKEKIFGGRLGVRLATDPPPDKMPCSQGQPQQGETGRLRSGGVRCNSERKGVVSVEADT